MAKKYLKDGDKIYSTGCWLVVKDNSLHFDGLDEVTFYDGKELDADDDGYYVEE